MRLEKLIKTPNFPEFRACADFENLNLVGFGWIRLDFVPLVPAGANRPHLFHNVPAAICHGAPIARKSGFVKSFHSAHGVTFRAQRSETVKKVPANHAKDTNEDVFIRVIGVIRGLSGLSTDLFYSLSGPKARRYTCLGQSELASVAPG